jgi:signal transduction histidine kinase
MKRSELVFAAGATPIAAYDLFGRLRELNDAMRSHLQAAGCAPFQLSAADLVATLSGGNLPFARICLRYVIHNRRDLSLPAEGQGERHFLLRIYPLENQENAPVDEPGPFGLAGVCCELLEQTAAIQLQRLKKQFTGQVGNHLRNDLAAVELSSSLLTDDLPRSEREELVGLIHEKVGQIVKTLGDAQQFYEAEALDGSARLPLDPRKLLAEVAAEEEGNARARGVGVKVEGSELIAYTVAHPESLRRFFRAALEYLIDDARSGSNIIAEANDSSDAIVYTIRNDGFGVPGERLAEFLASPEILTDRILEALRVAASEVSGWGGQVEASSTPGAGTVIRIALPRFV